MTAARCDWSDLDPAMCSHCRGLDEPELVERRELFVAQFRTRCSLCDRRIHEGDPMGSVDGQWICARHFA